MCANFYCYTSTTSPTVKKFYSYFNAQLHGCLLAKTPHWVHADLIHCSKHLRDQTFKAIYLEMYWEKSFQIAVLLSRIIVRDNTVVAKKKLAKL